MGGGGEGCSAGPYTDIHEGEGGWLAEPVEWGGINEVHQGGMFSRSGVQVPLFRSVESGCGYRCGNATQPTSPPPPGIQRMGVTCLGLPRERLRRDAAIWQRRAAVMTAALKEHTGWEVRATHKQQGWEAGIGKHLPLPSPLPPYAPPPHIQTYWLVKILSAYLRTRPADYPCYECVALSPLTSAEQLHVPLDRLLTGESPIPS